MVKPVGTPLPKPKPPAMLTAGVVAAGLPIPPIDRIKIFSPDQWEEFVLEWATSLDTTYVKVERFGGAGDMGRDVVATVDLATGAWDNYQCKHYDHRLALKDIWLELGKLVFYTFTNHFPYPRRYYFVAPQGGSTKLLNLLKKPVELKAELISNWSLYCQDKITKSQSLPLAGPLQTYLQALDFSIFEAVPPLRIIDAHAKTRWHAARFGGGLQQRPPAVAPPASPSSDEAGYVRELLDAYQDHLKFPIPTHAAIAPLPEIRDHFEDSRIEFYSAETLRVFSRDTLPPGEFEKLQDEVHHGIKDELRAHHPDGYRRVQAVIRTARTLQLNAHPLHSQLFVRDYGGICHQLANKGKVRWVK